MSCVTEDYYKGNKLKMHLNYEIIDWYEANRRFVFNRL